VLSEFETMGELPDTVRTREKPEFV